MGNTCINGGIGRDDLPPPPTQRAIPSNPASVPAHFYQYNQSLRGGPRLTDINHWNTRLENNGNIPMVLCMKPVFSFFYWTKYPDKMFEYTSKYKVKVGLLQTKFEGTLLSNFGDYTTIYFDRYAKGIDFFIELRKFIETLRPLNPRSPAHYFFDVNVSFSVGIFDHSKPISDNYRYCHGPNVLCAISQCNLYLVSFSVNTPNADVNKRIQSHIRKTLSFVPFEAYTFDIPESITEPIFDILNKHCKYSLVNLINTNNGPERTRTGYRYTR